MKAAALYDFVGNNSGAEISFKAGDIITVTDANAGDGWWEGVNSAGESGFFPELYVQLLPPSEKVLIVESPEYRVPTPTGVSFNIPKPPAFPPPPALEASDLQSPSSEKFSVSSAAVQLNEHLWRSSPTTEVSVESQELPISGLHLQRQLAPTPPDMIETHSGNQSPNDAFSVIYPHDSVSLVNTLTLNTARSTNRNNNPIRKSLNRFCNFVASGTEEFLLSKSAAEESHDFESKTHIVNEKGLGPRWQTMSDKSKYDISIVGYENKTKFAGTKQYTAFVIHDAIWDTRVLRRYKHFEWLHKILAEKFSTISIPPLPEKQNQGRFGDEFIEYRKRGLERFLRRLARHPVIRETTVFHFFVTCLDEKAWKIGKRASEKDPFKKNRFLEMIEILNSDIPEDGDLLEANSFAKFSKSMKLNSQTLIDASNGLLFAAPTFANVYQRLSFAIRRLIRGGPKDKQNSCNRNGDWCWKYECETCAKLTSKIERVSATLKDVSGFWEDSANKACVPMIEQLKEYEGLIDSFNSSVELHDKTSRRLRELKTMAVAGSVNPERADEIMDKCYTVLNVVFSEMNRFHDERCNDFDKMVESFVSTQIEFHENMAERYKNLLKENSNVDQNQE